MSCLGDCWDLGPPPDTILFLPPPPAPSFPTLKNNFLQDNITSCVAQLCDFGLASGNGGGIAGNVAPPVDTNDYIDMSHREMESTNWTGSDTWLLVVVASSIGVLLLGALLALFLLKCREEQRQQTKHLEQRQISASATKARIHHHQTGDVSDNRMVWAALTPRGGTQHYVSDSTCAYRPGPPQIPPPVPPPPQPHLISDPEDHYETIDEHNYNTIGYPSRYSTKIGSFDNSDFDYEEPTPLMQLGYGQDMRCISTLRRLPPPPRPRVSSPTRIEHPNLPPLNLNPQLITMKRGTLTRRPSDTNTILKYNIN